MTKLGVLSTHAKLLRSKSPLQSWCIVKSLKLDNSTQVAVDAKLQRHPDADDTSVVRSEMPLRFYFTLVGIFGDNTDTRHRTHVRVR